MPRTKAGVTLLRNGLINSQKLGWGGTFLKEGGKKVLAARGDLTKVDWFDVITSTISSKLGFGIVGKSLTEITNAGFDININGDGIKVTSVAGVVGVEKSKASIFIDLTFSAFKLAVGEIAKDTKATKPSEESMKMMFDQAKTQLKEAIK